MEILKQDYRLKDGDLNYTFFDDDVSYLYNGLTQKYSPYWVRYEVGRIQESNLAYFPLGSLFRIPYEIETGIFRPNFIIGRDWKTGLYKIRWKYKKTAYSDVEYKEVPFIITTEGIYDFSEEVLGGYMDLAADLNIID